MRYFLNETTGGWMSVSGDVDLFNIVPDDFREVTEAEFNEAAGVITLEPPQPQEPEPVE